MLSWMAFQTNKILLTIIAVCFLDEDEPGDALLNVSLQYASSAVHYKWFQEPYLKGDNLVVLEPFGQFGVYQVERDLPIEPLPPRRLNIATDFTTPLPALVDTGSPAKLTKKLDDLNMEVGRLAQYWVVPLDAAVQFEVTQPASVSRFRNEDGAIRFSKGEIDFFIEHGWFSMIPQIWVIGKETPPTIFAYNEDMNASTYDARLMFFGYSYPVKKLENAIRPTSPHLTVRLGVE